MRSYLQAALALTCLVGSHQVWCEDHARNISGEWATQGYSARVRVASCIDDATLLCGEIVWLWNPHDDEGAPLLDLHNPRPELRQRSLIGLSLLIGVRLDTASKVPRWVGSIYDPESGRTYRASLTRPSGDVLEVKGCVLFVCRAQTWRRASSLCPSPLSSATTPKEMP